MYSNDQCTTQGRLAREFRCLISSSSSSSMWMCDGRNHPVEPALGQYAGAPRRAAPCRPLVMMHRSKQRKTQGKDLQESQRRFGQLVMGGDSSSWPWVRMLPGLCFTSYCCLAIPQHHFRGSCKLGLRGKWHNWELGSSELHLLETSLETESSASQYQSSCLTSSAGPSTCGPLRASVLSSSFDSGASDTAEPEDFLGPHSSRRATA